MKLTSDVIRSARIFLNPLLEREIDLRGRRIPAIENLGALKDQVDVLDLTDNELERIENIPRLIRLKWILASNNNISRIQDGLSSSIPNLKVLVLANNRISVLSEIDKLAEFKHLEVLNLDENPVQKRKNYRLYVIHKIPSVNILDLDRVRRKERLEAEKMFSSSQGKQFLNDVQKQGEAMSKDTTSSGIVLSEEQKKVVQKALMNATSQVEIERLEKMLRAGIVPDEKTMLQMFGSSGQATQIAPPSAVASQMQVESNEIENEDVVEHHQGKGLDKDDNAERETAVHMEEDAPEPEKDNIDPTTATHVDNADSKEDVDADVDAGGPPAPKDPQPPSPAVVDAPPSALSVEESEEDKKEEEVMDIAWIDKLKVTELKQELKSRGLDQKGNKAVLQQRLREALTSTT